MLDSFFSFVFLPLLDKFGIPWFVLFVSCFISILSCLVSKVLTPQSKIKRLTWEIKGLNRELQTHLGDLAMMATIRKEISQRSFRVMSYNVLPNIAILVFMIMFFPWLSSNLSLAPIAPCTPFNIDITLVNPLFYNQSPTMELPYGILLVEQNNSLLFYQSKLIGQEGNYTIKWIIDNTTYTKDVLITDKQRYVNNIEVIKDETVTAISVEHNRSVALTLFGYHINWLVEYIICSLFTVGLFRKILNVY